MQLGDILGVVSSHFRLDETETCLAEGENDPMLLIPKKSNVSIVTSFVLLSVHSNHGYGGVDFMINEDTDELRGLIRRALHQDFY